jgi:3-oxoacyl-[acyl-carrier protein] reductase
MRHSQGVRRVALITGVSRAAGIAAAIARRSAPSHDLMLSGLPAYDRGWEANEDAGDAPELTAELRGLGAEVAYLASDLAQPSAPERVIAAAVEELGGVDTLVAAHAHSKHLPLGSLSAEEIDRHLIVNVRATLLLVKAFAGAHDPDRGQGRIVLFSSGQRLGPMPAELPYVASKGALEALVLSLADSLAARGISVNAVNPGPTDTGLLRGEEHDAIRSRFPGGRWGAPEDAARAVEWLTSDDGAWITGQVLDSEGGFRRWGGASPAADA